MAKMEIESLSPELNMFPAVFQYYLWIGVLPHNLAYKTAIRHIWRVPSSFCGCLKLACDGLSQEKLLLQYSDLRHLNATECILRHSVTIKASDLLWCKFPLLKKSSFACQILGNEGQLFLGRLILASCWKLKQKPPPTLTFRNWFSEIAFFALLALRI